MFVFILRPQPGWGIVERAGRCRIMMLEVLGGIATSTSALTGRAKTARQYLNKSPMVEYERECCQPRTLRLTWHGHKNKSVWRGDGGLSTGLNTKRRVPVALRLPPPPLISALDGERRAFTTQKERRGRCAVAS